MARPTNTPQAMMSSWLMYLLSGSLRSFGGNPPVQRSTHRRGHYYIQIPDSPKFSRHTILADCRFQKFCGNNFHGTKIPLPSIRCSNISRSLIFEVQCQSTKNAKMTRLENLAQYDCLLLYIQNSLQGVNVRVFLRLLISRKFEL